MAIALCVGGMILFLILANSPYLSVSVVVLCWIMAAVALIAAIDALLRYLYAACVEVELVCEGEVLFMVNDGTRGRAIRDWEIVVRPLSAGAGSGFGERSESMVMSLSYGKTEIPLACDSAEKIEQLANALGLPGGKQASAKVLWR